MNSHNNIDTPSRKTIEPPQITQDVCPPSADSQGAGPEPVTVPRPSFEQLDPAEVAKALKVASMLSNMKPLTQKKKLEMHKKPSPPQLPPNEFIPRPPPIPFSGNSNPDAVALRATVDLLQVQKARATHNIQTLQRLKELNKKDPIEFLNQLKAGKLKPESNQSGILGPTLGPDLEMMLTTLDLTVPDEKEDGDENIHKDENEQQSPDYPRFPLPQQVVRTPAINWAKYGIVGETLDKMHEEQRNCPSLGEPERLVTRASQTDTPITEQHQYTEDREEKFVMAAPYDPLENDKQRSKKPY